jgi:hypothetical protein
MEFFIIMFMVGFPFLAGLFFGMKLCSGKDTLTIDNKNVNQTGE